MSDYLPNILIIDIYLCGHEILVEVGSVLKLVFSFRKIPGHFITWSFEFRVVLKGGTFG